MEKRTSPSSPTTITASSSPSKIAERRSRSVASASKLSRSAWRIESRERVRSPISSLAPDGSGTSKRPAAICSALAASRLIRLAISEAMIAPTSTPMITAIASARRRSPSISSNARVSASGGSATTTTVPRIPFGPKIGADAIVRSPESSAR